MNEIKKKLQKKREQQQKKENEKNRNKRNELINNKFNIQTRYKSKNIKKKC